MTSKVPGRKSKNNDLYDVPDSQCSADIVIQAETEFPDPQSVIC